ncbi:MAG: NnrS family protein [Campylobacterota bacterium]|nr:NnrS family protein [Campylobacterota bacterium]
MHMKFSEDPKNNYFFSKPHQPFFVLAFINAAVAMLIYLLAYKGMIILAVKPSVFHSYTLIYLMFTPAFFAFLFTTFPRFSSTREVETKSYMQVFTLYYLGAVLYLLGSIVSPIFSAVAMMLLFAGQFKGVMILHNIYQTTSIEDEHDTAWILYAMKIGVLSHLLFIVAKLFLMPLMDFSIQVSLYLYLFLLTFTIAWRMVPLFSNLAVEKNEKFFKIIFALLVLHLLLESIVTSSSFMVDLALGVIIGKELLSWKLPFPKKDPLLWILHLGIYWIPLAFIVAALSNFLTLILGIDFLFLDMHILVLGFLLTILIGLSTRVTLGHSGNNLQPDNWVKGLFVWTQVVVLVRILTSIISALGWNFTVLFDIAATLWIILFCAWALRFFTVLITGKKLT